MDDALFTAFSIALCCDEAALRFQVQRYKIFLRFPNFMCKKTRIISNVKRNLMQTHQDDLMLGVMLGMTLGLC